MYSRQKIKIAGLVVSSLGLFMAFCYLPWVAVVGIIFMMWGNNIKFFGNKF